MRVNMIAVTGFFVIGLAVYGWMTWNAIRCVLELVVGR